MNLYLGRLKADFDKQVAGVRKAWNYQTAAALHALCGVFLTTMNSLQRRIPHKDFVEEEAKLHEQFMQ